MSKKHSLLKSFTYAFEGLATAFRNEPNFKIQVVIAILCLLLAVVFKLSFSEIAILILTIGLVLILELINTTMEALVDLVSEEVKPKAKIAKDVSAAAVLLSAILSVIVGIFLFLPKLFKL
ncbi:MAG: diacylglycerol kinase family protein [bacterium]|nr:diacylglycerol kinase family protein [bacterium]